MRTCSKLYAIKIKYSKAWKVKKLEAKYKLFLILL